MPLAHLQAGGVRFGFAARLALRFQQAYMLNLYGQKIGNRLYQVGFLARKGARSWTDIGADDANNLVSYLERYDHQPVQVVLQQ